MSDDQVTTAEESSEAAAEAVNEPAGPTAKRIKIGKVRQFPPCTIRLPGCKSMDFGNVFPVDHPTGDFKKPFDHTCTSCMNKKMDLGEWELSDRG